MSKITIKGAWTAIPNKLLKDDRLSRDARLLGCMLYMHAGNRGVAFPSQDVLAEELQTSVRSVQRWLTELRNAGWIAWRQTLRNNEYTLLDTTEVASTTTAVSHGNTTAVSSGATAVSCSTIVEDSLDTERCTHPRKNTPLERRPIEPERYTV